MRRIIFILILLAAGVALAWFLVAHFNSPATTASAPAGASSSPVLPGADSTASSKYPPRDVPAGQKEFRSDLYDFSVLYPQDLNVKVTNEGGGASTIVFEDDKTAQGFQIFIVPFAGSQITDERFKEDEPSGVRDSLKSVTIDGATGASFFGKNDAIGDTAEVWFIRGGYLYEVTALKLDAAWLSNIMTTWKFL